MGQARRGQGRLFMVIDALPAALLTFPFVLGFCVHNGLPLHIGRMVGTATCQRFDVVYDVTLAGACRFTSGWARMLKLECGDGPVMRCVFASADGGTSHRESVMAKSKVTQFNARVPYAKRIKAATSANSATPCTCGLCGFSPMSHVA